MKRNRSFKENVMIFLTLLRLTAFYFPKILIKEDDYDKMYIKIKQFETFRYRSILSFNLSVVLFELYTLFRTTHMVTSMQIN